MIKYYEIEQDHKGHCLIKLREKHKKVLDAMDDDKGVDFKSGILFTKQIPNPLKFVGKIYMREPRLDNHPSHFFNSLLGPVVSEAFVKMLRLAGVDNFQLFPAVLEFPQVEKVWSDYYVLNEIGLVDVVNFKESESTTIMEGEEDEIQDFIAFESVVFSAQKLKNKKLRMFRLVQNTIPLFVTDIVLGALFNNEPPEGWGFLWERIPIE